MAPRSVLINVDVRRLAWIILIFCVTVEIAFVFLDYYINYRKLVEIGAMRRMFNIAREDGLASWFGATQTLLTGMTLWLIFLVVRNSSGPGARPWGWFVLAAFVTYMAVDDGAQLHERFGSTFNAINRDAGGDLAGYPSYSWQFFFGPVFVLLGMFTLGFLWIELKDWWLRTLVLAALAGWVLAVGLDFIEGLDEGHPWDLYTILAETYELDPITEAQFGKDGYAAVRHFSKSFEEVLEMLSMTTLWFVFLLHLGGTTDEIRLRLNSAES